MKKGILLFVMCLIWTFPVHAVSTLLTKFSQLVKALERGDTVKAVIHLDKCQISDPTLQSQLLQTLDGSSVGFPFIEYVRLKNTINNQTKDTVSTVFNHVIEYSPGVFYTFTNRLNVFEDNTAIFRLNAFHYHDHALALVIEWDCDISNGKDDNGLYLYDFP